MVEERNEHNPTVLVPYAGPDPRSDLLDVFVYLRPETNGVTVESTILRTVKAFRAADKDPMLVYMANVPGSYIVARRIVEHHYALRLFFAVHAGAVFSADMIRQFETVYNHRFSRYRVIGAFEALRRFSLDPGSAL